MDIDACGRGAGYDVVLRIEEAVMTGGFTPPKMYVHAANSYARLKMELAIRTIRDCTNRIVDRTAD